MVQNKTILLGFYQGLGDFISAVPVMNQLLSQGNRLVIVASKQNAMLAKVIRFRESAVEFLDYSLFAPNRPGALMQFVSQLVRSRPDLVYVSPHAQLGLSSWKIPLLLATVKTLFWRRGTIIGARDEKLSRLFDVILPVDKSLDLLHREWSLHNLAGSIDVASPPEYTDAIEWKFSGPEGIESPDLVIHPGASKSVRMWPIENYRELVELLGDSIPITMVGLEQELEPLRPALEQFSNVKLFTGSLVDVIRITAGAEAVITMDSGFSHITAFLGVHHLAIFGASSPEIHGPFARNSRLLFDRSMECQPCDQYECRFGHALCMQTISPSLVAGRLEAIWSVSNTPRGEEV